eukprot:1160428-Pleurochrysis_carterae.AAC.1
MTANSTGLSSAEPASSSIKPCSRCVAMRSAMTSPRRKLAMVPSLFMLIRSSARNDRSAAAQTVRGGTGLSIRRKVPRQLVSTKW